MKKLNPAILSLDQGTTSTRAIIFSPQGDIIASHSLEHQQYTPSPNYIEHDAEEIWQNALTVCQKAIQEAVTKGYKPTTMGITNQRETVVAWDKITGKPLAPALVWQDTRTTQYCENLAKKHTKAVRAKTGLPINPYFSATKMDWLLTHDKAVRMAYTNNTLCLGTIDTYLLFRLTGGKSYKTDVTNACRTLLFNIDTLKWDKTLCSLFSIPQNLLATTHPNTHNYGITANGLLPYCLPIQAMIGDQQSATVGQTCFKVGMVKSTYGTGNFIMLNVGNTPTIAPKGLLTTVLYQTEQQTAYAFEGSAMVCGSAIQWLRDKLNLINTAKETEALAESAIQNDTVYCVPAFTGLGAPHWQPNARAQFTGISLSTTKADMVRAVLDGLCYQTYDLLQAMNTPLTHLRVDGGMTNNNWFLQRLSNINNITLDKPIITETTALGAAYLAGLQNGIYASLEEIQTLWQKEKTYQPTMPEEKRKQHLKSWRNALKICLSNAQ